MSVSSCNSVNSAIMYNMEIMIKMPFVITLISAAIMIINFINFKSPFRFKKQCRSLSRTHKFQKRSTKIRLEINCSLNCSNSKVNASKSFNIDNHKIQKSKLIIS